MSRTIRVKKVTDLCQKRNRAAKTRRLPVFRDFFLKLSFYILIYDKKNDKMILYRLECKKNNGKRRFGRNMIWDYIVNTVKNLSFPNDIIDIAFICIVVYLILKFIRDTRAAQFAKGIVMVFVLYQVAVIFKLDATKSMIDEVINFGIIAILIIFQPELRSMLEKIGRRGFTKIFSITSAEDRRLKDSRIFEVIKSVVEAATDLSATKTGALIVMERDTKLGETINTGTIVNADPSPAMIKNIFFPKAPMHDGAMIIRDEKIYAAGCFLPLSNSKMDDDLGTRHHAALGISEVSDSIVVVVSEETGIISVAMDGKIKRNLTPENLNQLLRTNLLLEEDKKDIFANIKKKRRNKKNSEKETEAGK